MFYFRLENFVAESCRGRSGQGDVWLITAAGAEAGAPAEVVIAAIRRVFGGAGELSDPPLPTGLLDDRGLVLV